MSIDQLGIMILGPIAILLVSAKKDDARRWGYLVGCFSQPFWFYATITNQQWGMVVLAVICTFSWLKGVWNFLLQPYLIKREVMLCQKTKF